MTDKITKKQLRDFGFLIGIGFPLIIGWLIPFITGHAFRAWTLWISIPTLLIGLLSPRALRKPYFAWMKLGYLLGYVNSRIILGIVFIFVLQPIAYLMKAFGYDPLRSKKSNLLSYKERKEGSKVDLTRIF
tara:strand:+ start:966 stop:1358 length:393 start_codon:yes stop_codon:yes gene_type:complete